MRNLALFGAVMLACSAPAFAQTPPAQNPDTSSPSQESNRSSKEVMLTGCITEQNGKYVLITNTQSSISSPSASPTTPSNNEPSNPPSTQSSPSPSSRGSNDIELAGSQDFKKHVGHTVRVTGTMQKSSAMGNDTSSSTANNANRSSMHVTEIKMVSESCSMKSGSSSPKP
jgi:hypothetical protein